MEISFWKRTLCHDSVYSAVVHQAISRINAYSPAKGSFSDPSFGGRILWLKVIDFWEADIMGRLEGVEGKPSGSRTKSSYAQVGS